jgi:hypothetical protein
MDNWVCTPEKFDRSGRLNLLGLFCLQEFCVVTQLDMDGRYLLPPNTHFQLSTSTVGVPGTALFVVICSKGAIAGKSHQVIKD